MSKSKATFRKKEIEKKKAKKRQDKENKKLAKKESDEKSSFEDMIAYVDEFGRITNEPSEHTRTKVKAKDIEISIPKKGDSQEEDSIRKGTVSFYNASKGYGFIKEHESGMSYFVHVNNLLEEIKEGNLVHFEVEKSKKGLAAVQVKILR